MSTEREFDHRRPRNPNIPFFPTRADLRKYPRPKPVGLAPGARVPWLVAAEIHGVHAVEVYEAILRLTLGRDISLNVFICKAGVLQWNRMKERHMRHWHPHIDHGAVEEEDVSFVVLTGEQSAAVMSWLWAHNFYDGFSHLLTPFGLAAAAFVQLPCPSPEQIREDALRDLGLLGQRFSRSLLAPGAKPMPLSVDDMNRRIPGPDSPDIRGRAVDVEDRERIEWTSEAFYKGT